MEIIAHEPEERPPGRQWAVRLDSAGRGTAAVVVVCGHPSCPPQRLPSAAEGRRAAAEHLAAHLRSGGVPRPRAACVCRSEECRTHTAAGPRPRVGEGAWRCGGPVVLAVLTDRAGRLWRAIECCARCAAATPGARVAATAPNTPATRERATGAGDGERPGTGAPAFGPRFSHPQGAGPGPAVALPSPRRAVRAERPRPGGRIGQRTVPLDLHPAELREELIDLGRQYREYQQRTEPDLALLAGLHRRKAAAFAHWAEVTRDGGLRLEAERAEQAAATTLCQHRHRTGQADGDESGVQRLLSAPGQWRYARDVLDHVAEHPPLPGAEARLVALVLTLRTALTGVGNLVGQDLTALPLTDPERLVEELTGCGWLTLPGSAAELLASRPETPTRITVPSLMPRGDDPGPFAFGRKTRPKLSGWAQRVIGDKKLRKAKTAAEVRLLALTLATWSEADGRLGPKGGGLDTGRLADRCATAPEGLPELVERLTAADWLAEAATADGRLTGRLTERVLPLSCPPY
ncbi:hypothetical protein [Streptomyces lichenis]|uniref:Uncharacterized protein n=1 Tax=Streptomyces lichenis TaxID=2306967 RepID=A0ABT0IEH3_9ACTN|nr:hypothetical protein [Streptomyces lichenis]MCK8679728.1 hypothetical protein [Streptomyces lichenis]